MNSKTRLKEYARFKVLSNNQFTKQAGLSNGYLTGEGPIYTDSLLKISEVFGDLNLEWVLTGKGYMINPPITAADFTYPALQEERMTNRLDELKSEHPESIEAIKLFDDYIHSYSQTVQMLIENCKSKDLVIENQAERIKLLEDKLLLSEIEASKKKKQ